MLIGDERNDTKNTIIRETARLYSKKKGQRVTVADICAAVKIKKSTFYYHFHSIDEVVDSVAGLLSNFVSESMVRILSFTTCYEQICELFACMDDEIITFGVSLMAERKAIMLKNRTERDFPLKEVGYDILYTLLKRAEDLGELSPDADINRLAKSCFYIARGVCETWVASDGDFNLKTEVLANISLFLKPYFILKA